MRTRALLLVWLLAGFPTAAGAQPAAALVLRGAVTDSSGGAIAGATIEVRTRQGVLQTMTDPGGGYELTAPTGAVEIVVTKEGFQPEIAHLRLADGTHVHDVRLQIGAVTDTAVVTATLVETATSQLAGSVTTFDAEAIRARGARSLAEVLQQTPGVQIEATGREGALTSLFARGGDSDYNLVLVDGVRVTLPGGRFDFGRVDTSQIDRVEIVRGSQSALYGSDAIGAVVQVFTRRSSENDPPNVQGSIEGGSFGAMRVTSGVSTGVKGRANVHVGGAYRETDGAFADLLPEQDRFDQSSFDTSGGVRVGRGVTTRASLRYDKAHGRSVGQIAYRLFDTGTYYDTRDVSVDLRLAHDVSPSFRHQIAVGIFDYNNSTGDRAVDGPWSVYAVMAGTPGALFPDSTRLIRLVNRAEFDTLRTQTLPTGQFLASRINIADFASATRMDSERRSFRYQGDWNQAADATLTGGYDYEHEDDPNNVSFGRHNHALFVQQQWRAMGRLFVSGGARLDHNSRYGDQLSPKLSVSGFIVPFRQAALSSFKLQTNIGRGIKNPVFAELFGGATVDGNPALEPERATTFDAGAEVSLASQRFAGVVTYFANRYRDQVAFRSSGPGRDGIPDYLNIEGSNADGLEVEARLQRPLLGFTASAFYTLVDTKVTATISTSEQFQPGQPLLRRPKHSGSVFVSWQRGPGTVSAGLRVVGQRHDSSFLSLATLATPQSPSRVVDIRVNPGYHAITLTGEYRVRTSVGIFARIENLTDERYESALGFPGLPRSAAAGLRVDFRRR